MNRCLRSLPCLLTLAGLALFSTDAAARGSRQQQHAKKTEAKTSEAKKAQPHRSAAVGKRRHAKHAAAHSKSKRSKEAPAEKLTRLPIITRENLDQYQPAY